jgi:nucleoside-diphosphate-sugar epimerase
VLDAESLGKAIEGANFVIHCAAIAGVDTVLESPVRTMRVNLLGTMNMLEAAQKLPELERFVEFSTSEVFGTHAYKVEETHITTQGSVGEARWTYAVSKLAGEYLSHSYYHEFRLPAVTVRPFNIYGPNQVGVGAIHHFVRRALQGRDIEIHGDGSQIRAWCYISDIVDALLLILEKPESIGQVFNIGNPRSTVTIYDLAKHVLRISGSSSKLVFRPINYVDVEIRVPSIEKGRSLLGFDPKVDLEDGLKATIAWYRSER